MKEKEPEALAGLEEAMQSGLEEVWDVVDAVSAEPAKRGLLFHFQGHFRRFGADKTLEFIDAVLRRSGGKILPSQILVFTEGGPPQLWEHQAPQIAQMPFDPVDFAERIRPHYAAGSGAPVPLELMLPDAAQRQRVESAYRRLQPIYQKQLESARWGDPGSEFHPVALSAGLASRGIPQRSEVFSLQSWVLSLAYTRDFSDARRFLFAQGDQPRYLAAEEARHLLLDWLTVERDHDIRLRQMPALLSQLARPDSPYKLIIGALGRGHAGVASAVEYGSALHATYLEAGYFDELDPTAQLSFTRAAQNRIADSYSPAESDVIFKQAMTDLLSLLLESSVRIASLADLNRAVRETAAIPRAQVSSLYEAVRQMRAGNALSRRLADRPGLQQYAEAFFAYAWLNSAGLLPDSVRRGVHPYAERMNLENWERVFERAFPQVLTGLEERGQAILDDLTRMGTDGSVALTAHKPIVQSKDGLSLSAFPHWEKGKQTLRIAVQVGVSMARGPAPWTREARRSGQGLKVNAVLVDADSKSPIMTVPVHPTGRATFHRVLPYEPSQKRPQDKRYRIRFSVEPEPVKEEPLRPPAARAPSSLRGAFQELLEGLQGALAQLQEKFPLEEREAGVLRLRYDLRTGERPLTQEQVAGQLGFNSKMVGGYERKVIRKWGHPVRLRFFEQTAVEPHLQRFRLAVEALPAGQPWPADAVYLPLLARFLRHDLPPLRLFSAQVISILTGQERFLRWLETAELSDEDGKILREAVDGEIASRQRRFRAKLPEALEIHRQGLYSDFSLKVALSQLLLALLAGRSSSPDATADRIVKAYLANRETSFKESLVERLAADPAFADQFLREAERLQAGLEEQVPVGELRAALQKHAYFVKMKLRDTLKREQWEKLYRTPNLDAEAVRKILPGVVGPANRGGKQIAQLLAEVVRQVKRKHGVDESPLGLHLASVRRIIEGRRWGDLGGLTGHLLRIAQEHLSARLLRGEAQDFRKLDEAVQWVLGLAPEQLPPQESQRKALEGWVGAAVAFLRLSSSVSPELAEKFLARAGSQEGSVWASVEFAWTQAVQKKQEGALGLNEIGRRYPTLIQAAGEEPWVYWMDAMVVLRWITPLQQQERSRFLGLVHHVLEQARAPGQETAPLDDARLQEEFDRAVRQLGEVPVHLKRDFLLAKEVAAVNLSAVLHETIGKIADRLGESGAAQALTQAAQSRYQVIPALIAVDYPVWRPQFEEGAAPANQPAGPSAAPEAGLEEPVPVQELKDAFAAHAEYRKMKLTGNLKPEQWQRLYPVVGLDAKKVRQIVGGNIPPAKRGGNRVAQAIVDVVRQVKKRHGVDETPMGRHVASVRRIVESSRWGELEGQPRLLLRIADEVLLTRPQPETPGLRKLDELLQWAQQLPQERLPRDPVQRKALERWQAVAVAFLRMGGVLSPELADKFLARPESLEGYVWVILDEVWTLLVQQQREDLLGLNEIGRRYPELVPGGREKEGWTYGVDSLAVLRWTTPLERFDTSVDSMREPVGASLEVIRKMIEHVRPPEQEGTPLDPARLKAVFDDTVRHLGTVPLHLRRDFLLGKEAAAVNLSAVFYEVIGRVAAPLGEARAAEYHARMAQHRYQAIHALIDASYPVWRPQFEEGAAPAAETAGLEEAEVAVQGPDGPITWKVPAAVARAVEAISRSPQSTEDLVPRILSAIEDSKRRSYPFRSLFEDEVWSGTLLWTLEHLSELFSRMEPDWRAVFRQQIFAFILERMFSQTQGDLSVFGVRYGNPDSFEAWWYLTVRLLALEARLERIPPGDAAADEHLELVRTLGRLIAVKFHGEFNLGYTHADPREYFEERLLLLGAGQTALREPIRRLREAWREQSVMDLLQLFREIYPGGQPEADLPAGSGQVAEEAGRKDEALRRTWGFKDLLSPRTATAVRAWEKPLDYILELSSSSRAAFLQSDFSFSALDDPDVLPDPILFQLDWLDRMAGYGFKRWIFSGVLSYLSALHTALSSGTGARPTVQELVQLVREYLDGAGQVALRSYLGLTDQALGADAAQELAFWEKVWQLRRRHGAEVRIFLDSGDADEDENAPLLNAVRDDSVRRLILTSPWYDLEDVRLLSELPPGSVWVNQVYVAEQDMDESMGIEWEIAHALSLLGRDLGWGEYGSAAVPILGNRPLEQFVAKLPKQNRSDFKLTFDGVAALVAMSRPRRDGGEDDGGETAPAPEPQGARVTAAGLEELTKLLLPAGAQPPYWMRAGELVRLMQARPLGETVVVTYVDPVDPAAPPKRVELQALGPKLSGRPPGEGAWHPVPLDSRDFFLIQLDGTLSLHRVSGAVNYAGEQALAQVRKSAKKLPTRWLTRVQLVSGQQASAAATLGENAHISVLLPMLLQAIQAQPPGIERIVVVRADGGTQDLQGPHLTEGEILQAAQEVAIGGWLYPEMQPGEKTARLLPPRDYTQTAGLEEQAEAMLADWLSHYAAILDQQPGAVDSGKRQQVNLLMTGLLENGEATLEVLERWLQPEGKIRKEFPPIIGVPLAGLLAGIARRNAESGNIQVVERANQVAQLVPQTDDPARVGVWAVGQILAEAKKGGEKQAGLEEVRIVTRVELAAVDPELPARLGVAEKQEIALLPVQAASPLPQRLVHLFGHRTVTDAAITLLPDEWGLDRWEILPTENAAYANELLEEANRSAGQGFLTVIALDPASLRGLVLQDGHPLALLLNPNPDVWKFDPRTGKGINPQVLSAFVSQLAAKRNLVLDLTSGSIQVVEIPGWGEFYAIPLAQSA